PTRRSSDLVGPPLVRRDGEDALPALRALDHEEVASAVAEVFPEGAGLEGVGRVVGDGDAVGAAGQHPPGGEPDHGSIGVPGDAGLHLGLAPGGAPVLRDRYRGGAAGAEEPARQRAVWNFDNSQESAGIVYLRPGHSRVGRAVDPSIVGSEEGIGAAEGAGRTDREEGGREDLLAHDLDPGAGPAGREVEVVEG